MAVDDSVDRILSQDGGHRGEMEGGETDSQEAGSKKKSTIDFFKKLEFFPLLLEP